MTDAGAAAVAVPPATDAAMRLPAAATFDEAAAIAATLPAAVAGGSGVLRVDASDLQTYDSSTLSLLMQARRLAHAAGRGFEVVGAPGQLLQLAQLYGIDELLGAPPP